MTSDIGNKWQRRAFIAGGAAMFGVPALAQDSIGTIEIEDSVEDRGVRRNISAFRTLEWQPYFSNLDNGAILVDIDSRAVHYWSQDESIYKLYPSSVPMTDDLTRRGRTRVTFKDPNPDWTPTPSMRERDPDLPAYVPPGPNNPLGTRALHLSWTYYRIHGTHDTRKIGRRSSSGCVGLYNEHIEELYRLANVGTQVLLI